MDITSPTQDLATMEEMQSYLSTFRTEDKYQAERDDYLRAHLLRLRATLGMIPPGQEGDTLLELGAAPYLMTFLLKHYTDYGVRAAGYRGDDFPPEFEIIRHRPEYDERHTLTCQNFNVERDRFPYPDASFDVILCCEILEHLVADPTHMLVEIHRILKPGGSVLITTPNVLVLRNVNMLLRKKKNIYGPYSGYGMYGRHNREWTSDEVIDLVRGCGFRIEMTQLLDTYPHHGYSAWLKKFFPHLRDMICVLARAEGEPNDYYPEHLYAATYANRVCVTLGG